MRKLFLLIFISFPFLSFAQAQDNFSLKGKIANAVPPGKVYLFYTLGANQVVDSSAISIGSFSFSGSILQPEPAILAFDHKGLGLNKLDQQHADILPIYIEPGTILVTALDSVAKAKITGSPVNDDNQLLMAQINVIRDKAKKIQYDAQRATIAQQKSEDYQAIMQARYKSLQNEQEQVLQDFVKAHPKSYISLLALSSLGGPTANAAVLEPLYNSLDPALKSMEAGKQLKSAIDQLKIIGIGAVAPDFTQNDTEGRPVKLSSFRGKYILIDFWASWCGPCREENPYVVKAYNRYKNKNFTILGVSLDKPEAKDAWLNAIKSDGLTWTQVSDLRAWDNEAARLYKVTSIPKNFLVDPQGKIIATNLRGHDLENKLKEIFGAPVPVKGE